MLFLIKNISKREEMISERRRNGAGINGCPPTVHN
jgi:hypothetical protein